MQIELKEGKHFDVDRAQGTITFKVPPCKGAKTSIGFGMTGPVTVIMKTGLFRGWWFLLASRLTRAR